MPFDLPMTFREWLVEVTCVYYYWFEAKIFVTSALGRFTPNVLRFTPQNELWKLKWSARFYLAAYGVLVAIIAMGHLWPLWLFILPRILGAPVMQLFTILQHAELSENAPSILASTRSFRTSWLASFLYMNMNNHVEHHLYPQVPFYALPDLRDALEKQVPAQDPGLWRTNWEVLSVVVRRSLGMNTKAATIRQAPHMVTTGGFTKVAKATMR